MSGRVVRGVPLPGGSTPASDATRLENGFRFGLYSGLGGWRAPIEPPPPHLTFEFTWSVPWTLAEPPSCGGLIGNEPQTS